MKTSFRLILALVGVVCSSVTAASSEAIEGLRQAMIDKDMQAFERVLDARAIALDEFSSNVRLYEIACASTTEVYAPFFDRLLAYGLDPSTEDPTSHPFDFSLLDCAQGRYNAVAFKKLLDAGARSDIYLCNPCVSRFPEPLVERVVDNPQMFMEVVKRRELTNAELISVGKKVERIYFHKIWQGQPLNEFYADYLRKYGINVTPKRKYGEE